jgi:phosphatidylserine/phosphatidylglycerophosphate/cardiolipin synthase-like enzyme
MDSIKAYIDQALDDNFLSKDEVKHLRLLMSAGYLSPRDRVYLVQYAIDRAAVKATPENQQYLFKWLKKVTQTLGDFGSDEMHNNAYFSHVHDLRDKVISCLEGAGQTLSISLFTISDNPISQAIREAHSRGVQVKIVTDDEKITDMGSDIFRLKHHGIPVKIDSSKSLMHHKFVVIDRNKVLTGSFNWTRSASEINNENILITNNQRIVSAFNQEFERLWEQMEML